MPKPGTQRPVSAVHIRQRHQKPAPQSGGSGDPIHGSDKRHVILGGEEGPGRPFTG